MNKKPIHKNILILGLLGILFIGPFVAAHWLFNHMAAGEYKTLQSGKLINPPLFFSELVQKSQASGLQTVKGHWLLLYLNFLPCQDSCKDNLYKMRQVRLALGKDRNRVQRMVITSNADPILDQLLSHEYTGTIHALVNRKCATDFFSRLSSYGIALQEESLYLVDPLGNLIMAYPANIAPKDLLKDLNRLLKVSQIG